MNHLEDTLIKNHTKLTK